MKRKSVAIMAVLIVAGLMTATLCVSPRAAANPSVPPPDQLYGIYELSGVEAAYFVLFVMYNDLTIKQYGDFIVPQMRDLMVDKLDNTMNMIEQGKYDGARDKILSDILDKVDGKWMTNDWDNLPWTFDSDEKDYRVWLEFAAEAVVNPDATFPIQCVPYFFCVVCPLTCFALLLAR